MTTLADAVIRETYRPRTDLRLMTDRPMADVRSAIANSRRFVMDERMSAFMADIQQVPFMSEAVRRPGVMDTMRHGALLPHAKTWIEFSGRAFRRRIIENNPDTRDPWGDRTSSDPNQVPATWGWLLEQHPRLESVISLSEFAYDGDEEDQQNIFMLPFTCVWNVRDEPFPWKDVDTVAGMVLHGLTGYRCPHIGCRLARPLKKFEEMEIREPHERGGQVLSVTHRLVGEMAGLTRYALALLSSLNDIPVIRGEVRPSKGYVARGSYRRFVEHTTIHLNIPMRQDTRRVAKRIFAASRRKMHTVRGHWRNYLRSRSEERLLCHGGMHSWGQPDDTGHATCSACPAWRTWIAEHDRGDATLGVVTHDYAVTHHL